MNRSNSLENLSRNAYSLRDTAGRQARRVEQAAIPTSQSSRTTLSHPSKTLKNSVPFSTISSTSSSAAPLAVGVVEHSTSRIQRLKAPTTPPPPPPNSSVLTQSKEMSVQRAEDQPHQAVQTSIPTMAAPASTVLPIPSSHLSFNHPERPSNSSTIGQRFVNLYGTFAGVFQRTFRGPHTVLTPADQATLPPRVHPHPRSQGPTLPTPSSGPSQGAISSLGIAPSSALLLAQSTQVAAPSTLARAAQTPEDLEDRARIEPIKLEIDRVEPAPPSQRRILRPNPPIPPESMMVDEMEVAPVERVGESSLHVTPSEVSGTVFYQMSNRYGRPDAPLPLCPNKQ